MTAAAYWEVRMGAELNPAQELHALGQSLWLDSINRVMLRTGALARYVRELAVTGLTSNPTILGHAMAAESDHGSARHAHPARGPDRAAGPGGSVQRGDRRPAVPVRTDGRMAPAKSIHQARDRLPRPTPASAARQ